MTTAQTAPALVVVDTPNQTAVVQPGHPSTKSSAYTIDVPYAGATMKPQELDAAVQQWVQANSLPLNSNVYAVPVANTINYTLTTTLTRN